MLSTICAYKVACVCVYECVRRELASPDMRFMEASTFLPAAGGGRQIRAPRGGNGIFWHINRLSRTLAADYTVRKTRAHVVFTVRS